MVDVPSDVDQCGAVIKAFREESHLRGWIQKLKFHIGNAECRNDTTIANDLMLSKLVNLSVLTQRAVSVAQIEPRERADNRSLSKQGFDDSP